MRAETSKIENNNDRDSSIELCRIFTMLFIIAHHYVVNSGVIGMIKPENAMQFNSIFALLFGWGGKTGINCFVLITGYFMCKSNITLRKFFKLFLEIEFYKIVFFLIFLITGYADFSFENLYKTLFPLHNIGNGFTSSFLVFYLFIPYLNKLLTVLTQKEHMQLIGICVLTASIIQTFMEASRGFTYIGWFMILYFIAAYIRLYPKEMFESKKIGTVLLVTSLILSFCSVFIGTYIYSRTGKSVYYDYVADSNKFLALITSVSVFLFFKNLRIKYHPLINKVAASTYGVLLVHANSDTMRKWLWRDVLKNVEYFESNFFVLPAIGSVIGVFIISTFIDRIRIKFIEDIFFDGLIKIGNRLSVFK